MRLREIMRFRRVNSTRAVPMEVLTSLELPMPDDVLEQFVFDHGTNGDFQVQYGHLDLHAMRWQQHLLLASEILACSVHPPFARRVETVSGWTRLVANKGWSDVGLSQTAVENWQKHGTWMRAPIMLRGELVGSAMPLHLVEGHTRTGALKGFVMSGLLLPASTHRVWVGEACQPDVTNDRWRTVLSTEPISFLDWMLEHVGDDGPIGDMASKFIDCLYNSWPRKQINGPELKHVVSFAEANDFPEPMIARIPQLHSKWLQFVSE